MQGYFPQEEVEELTSNQEKAFRSPETYRAVTGYLVKEDEGFRTDDLLEANDGKLDHYRVKDLLGAFREVFGIIDGEFRGGNYYWSPDLEAEGSWFDVWEELEELNSIEKTV